MLQHSWIFLGVVALIATTMTMRTTDDQLAIISGLVGTIAWALWGYSALNVVAYSNGTQFAHQYPSLAAFGVVMAIPNLYVVLYGPLRIAREPSNLTDELR